jgi:hypothetical protein
MPPSPAIKKAGGFLPKAATPGNNAAAGPASDPPSRKIAEWNIQPLGHAGDGFDHRKIFLFLDGRQRLPRHMREFVKLVERQPAFFAQFTENRRQRQNGQGRMVAIHARTISNSRLLIFHTAKSALSAGTNRVPVPVKSTDFRVATAPSARRIKWKSHFTFSTTSHSPDFFYGAWSSDLTR